MDRVVDDGDEVSPHRVELDLVPKSHDEGIDGPRRVVPCAVEASINGVLRATPDRLEQRDD